MNPLLIKLTAILSLTVFFALFVRFIVLRAILAEKIGTHEGAKNLLKSLTTPLLLLALTFGAHLALNYTELRSHIPASAATALSILTIITGALLCLRGCRLFEFIFNKSMAKTASNMDAMLVPIARKTIQVMIAIVALLLIAQHLSGKNMASILTGLGVGGLAIALAAQETIKNFFGSIVICADKPFELNERIKTDGIDGTVEHVGFRSTRIRTLEGHLLTVPNGELANKSIENVTRRPHIKRMFYIDITYNTSPEKVELALEIIKELLDHHEGMHDDFPPRVCFDELAAFSLKIMVIFWYRPADYWALKAFNERLNLELLRRFNAAGIEFAFPTQTLYLNHDAKQVGD